jgi:hypothetical protein
MRKNLLGLFSKGLLAAALVVTANTTNASTNISPGNFNPIDTLVVGNTYAYSWTSNATGTGSGSATVTLSWTSTALFGAGSVSGVGGTTKSFSITPTLANLGLQSITITTSSTNGGTFAGGTKQVYVMGGCNMSASVSDVTDVSCFGGDNGTISISLDGGTAPYSYSWSPAASGNPATGLAAGTYNVTVTDANGCTASTSATVGQPATALSASATATDVTCFGLANGTITVSANGGTSPYVSGTGTTTGYGPGTYTITVTDNNGCMAEATATVSEPSQLVASASASPSTFYLGYSTSATLTAGATGGTPSYSYSWSPISSTASTVSVSPATPGTNTYTVTVTDANGCTAAASANINVIDVRCWAGNSNVQKVQICHKVGNKWNTLCVDYSAVAAHLAHGDYLGACNSGAKGTEENTLETMQEEAIHVYPNPASSMIFVELPANVTAEKVMLMDMTGKVISQQNNITAKATFNLGNMAPGLYFIQVAYGNEVFRSKVMVQ